MSPTESKRDPRSDELSGLVEGDPAAWSDFVEEHLPVIYGTVLRTLRSYGSDHHEDVEDLVQDVLVRCCRRDYELLRRFDARRASWSTYLSVVARSVTVDALRRRQSAEPLEAERQVSEPARAERPRLEVPQRLLSPRQRLVLHLLYDRDLETSDVALILQIETQTVRSTHHKALEKLRRWFAGGERNGGPTGPGST